MPHQTKLAPGAAPTAEQLGALASLCSPAEWDRLLISREFLAAAGDSLSTSEAVASRLIGRKISVSKPALKNLSDSEL